MTVTIKWVILWVSQCKYGSQNKSNNADTFLIPNMLKSQQELAELWSLTHNKLKWKFPHGIHMCFPGIFWLPHQTDFSWVSYGKLNTFNSLRYYGFEQSNTLIISWSLPVKGHKNTANCDLEEHSQTANHPDTIICFIQSFHLMNTSALLPLLLFLRQDV